MTIEFTPQPDRDPDVLRPTRGDYERRRPQVTGTPPDIEETLRTLDVPLSISTPVRDEARTVPVPRLAAEVVTGRKRPAIPVTLEPPKIAPRAPRRYGPRHCRVPEFHEPEDLFQADIIPAIKEGPACPSVCKCCQVSGSVLEQPRAPIKGSGSWHTKYRKGRRTSSP